MPSSVLYINAFKVSSNLAFLAEIGKIFHVIDLFKNIYLNFSDV
jgi:hypothetical protein